jgi:hypothetical protein
MKYLSPAKTITPLEETSLEATYSLLIERVNQFSGFKSHSISDQYAEVQVFSKGSPLIDFVEDWIPIFRYESYFFLLLEKDTKENRIILTLQDFTYRKTSEDLEEYLQLFAGLPADKFIVSDWFEAATLPRKNLSHPITFMKSRGLAGWLL